MTHYCRYCQRNTDDQPGRRGLICARCGACKCKACQEKPPVERLVRAARSVTPREIMFEE